MSIHGINGPYNTPASRPAPTARPDHATRAGVPANAPAPATRAPAQAANAGVSVAPPPGTDPELWTVLTPDERAYFARLGAMGPLTYGRVLSGQPPAMAPAARGVRLDVKA